MNGAGPGDGGEDAQLDLLDDHMLVCTLWGSGVGPFILKNIHLNMGDGGLSFK